MKTKMKFVWCGVNFELPAECLRTTDYWGKTLDNPYISIGRKECPAIAKQFMKAKYPHLLVWGSSETFANGNSASVYVCNADGTPLDRASKEWKDIYGFVDQMSGGRYNGMEDIYEYREDELTTDNGMALKYFPSYIFIENKPKWGSVEYWSNEYKTLQNNLTNPDYTRMVELVKKAGSFLEYNKTYMTKGEYNKCVSSGIFS